MRTSGSFSDSASDAEDEEAGSGSGSDDLGEGAFGKVGLVTHRLSGKTYAAKILDPMRRVHRMKAAAARAASATKRPTAAAAALVAARLRKHPRANPARVAAGLHAPWHALAAAGADLYASMGSTYFHKGPADAYGRAIVDGMLTAFPRESVVVGIGSAAPRSCPPPCVVDDYKWTEASLSSFLQFLQARRVGAVAVWLTDIAALLANRADAAAILTAAALRISPPPPPDSPPHLVQPGVQPASSQPPYPPPSVAFVKEQSRI